MPRPPAGMKHGRRIIGKETGIAAVNRWQRAGGCGGEKFPVDVQQFLDRRVGPWEWHGDGLADAPQPLCERVANSSQTLGPQAGERLETTIIRCRLQIGQAVDPQALMQTPRKGLSDCGNRTKQGDRIVFASQAIEHPEPTVRQPIANRMRDGLSGRPAAALRSGRASSANGPILPEMRPD